MLILNAGVFGMPFMKTGDGFETTFQVNHLAQLYLVLLLRPLLVTGSRVVFVSSESHRYEVVYIMFFFFIINKSTVNRHISAIYLAFSKHIYLATFFFLHVVQI